MLWEVHIQTVHITVIHQIIQAALLLYQINQLLQANAVSQGNLIPVRRPPEGATEEEIQDQEGSLRVSSNVE